MVIEVDLSREPAVVRLEHPEDCRHFHLEVRGGDTTMLGQVLRREGIGDIAPSGEIMIRVDSLHQMARGQVPATWDEDFSRMLAYARDQGWLSGGGSFIQAHVEWLEHPPRVREA